MKKVVLVFVLVSLISGWGKTSEGKNSEGADKLQAAEMELLSWKNCVEKVFPAQFTENMICATGNTGEGGCNGDSGGI